MRTYRWLLLISTVVLVVASCRSQQQPAPAAQGPKPIGTVREVMHGIVEYNAFEIFNSVAVTITSAGTNEKQPRTDEEWDQVEHAALAMAEAANLLTMPGRPISLPEDIDKAAGPDELTPRQIQEKIDANRDAWLKYLSQLQSVGVEVRKIVADKNVQGLFEVGEKIDQICENCHMEFWYPDAPPAP